MPLKKRKNIQILKKKSNCINTNTKTKEKKRNNNNNNNFSLQKKKWKQRHNNKNFFLSKCITAFMLPTKTECEYINENLKYHCGRVTLTHKQKFIHPNKSTTVIIRKNTTATNYGVNSWAKKKCEKIPQDK